MKKNVLVKNLLVVLFSLALSSLACLTTGGGEAPRSAATDFIEIESGAVYEVPELTSAPVVAPSKGGLEPADSADAVTRCARVIALEALHLRKGPSETEIALAWLRRGDVVRVVSTVGADWWLVEYGMVVGYARSFYLKESECE